MKKSLVVLLFCLFAFCGTTAVAQMIGFDMEIVQHNEVVDTITEGQPFTLNVYLESYGSITGFYFLPEFYSPDLSLSSIVQLPSSDGDSLFGNMRVHENFNDNWTMGLWIDPEDWDGVLPDNFIYSGVTLSGWSGNGRQLYFSGVFQINDAGLFGIREKVNYDYTYDYPLYDFATRTWLVVGSDLCGDVNNDSSVNLLDILHIVWCVYTNPDPGFDCDPSEWDVNDDGDSNILDIIYLIYYLYTDGPEPICGPAPEPNGVMLNHSDCLPEKGVMAPDCIDYTYDENAQTLQFTHQNAAFNCCFDSLTTEIVMDGALIDVYEYENPSGGLCDCICDYNINYEINNLMSGIYTIRFNSAYQPYGYIEFEVDLSAAISGTICLD